MLNSINDNIIDSIASQRNISSTKIHQDANQLKLSSAKICLEEKYVDGILYEDQVKDNLRLLLGEEKLKIIYSIIKDLNVGLNGVFISSPFGSRSSSLTDTSPFFNPLIKYGHHSSIINS